MQATAQRFRLNELCGVNGSSYLVETAGGYAILQTDQVPADGRRVLLCAFGRLQIAVVMGGSLITEDGEYLEGEALDDVRLVGVVTHTIHPVSSDENPFM